MNIGAIMQNLEISVQRVKTTNIAVNGASAADGKVAAEQLMDVAHISAATARVDQEEKAVKEKIEPIKPPEISGQELFALKAVFARDEEKNVIIRFLDETGQIVRQFPPEEYLNMLNKFQRNLESLFINKV
ncbi:MAG: flagellar protein FlaG [Gallionella sp.]|nr:flagellar protein FlaG [Gallionella sp.]